MARHPCPRCQTVIPRPRLLNIQSSENFAYYRCDVCGHVWTLRRNDPDATPRAVTIFADDARKVHQ